MAVSLNQRSYSFCLITTQIIECYWYELIFGVLERILRGWGPDSGRWGRFMKAVKLFSDPTKTKIYKRPALWSACVYA